MSSDSLMLGLALIMAVVAVVGVGLTYSSVSNLENALTGFATDEATTNLSVESNTAINFTTDNINFGTGTIVNGSVRGVLSSTGLTTNTTGFTAVTQGFVLENIGNTNATLKIKTGKIATTFLGGTSPKYQFNVTNKEASSCETWNAGYTAGEYVDAATSDNTVCDKFQDTDASDELRIDILLVVPSDSFTGALGDVMTATASPASPI